MASAVLSRLGVLRYGILWYAKLLDDQVPLLSPLPSTVLLGVSVPAGG